ncbi:MAG: 2-amino-4-hydroxy-6-hydroxymethyldihydropteridine diphosphokinase [Halomonas sp.]|jgi:2-amino-4-hydroxy-6-hydroxymethyldihydropteridine diphosphokinase|uniref:2-amino-4-hydroxy-6-hydroxymethyldihydropteridine pyrophosphokinase n=1 Tax=Billgrantia tianxiuensis TaxID=2497861 RepID=A0A6I6SM52_9GAMM|nr:MULTISPECIES: 2-amino-4-hydroxy-6-hydroxymethyldihydropteridine diphosphokinase [Halomonas]MCE8035871.1 2-amino-4-hydroxy-6-hydroxymethyldihydropteridine diphosphokinase [Halomonas sp. MCCC 1A11057]MDX5376230.1 2-amino-4-hydroxy-6-hydroxymethyldihydropteridine diphosphokinase [Halomonas sp.]MDX5502055.1 2-amino-4-hydroxy-6-hydroxymethyldihydropteridine diphosphokinase [Halomonas sp.]QHC51739.1 2-amino-4-hydroxy-6-hydroxymethyldihydropteridine diphosphokinase [Halomonas tianxiuensis]
MTPFIDVYVGLGSNLDDPVDQVRRALDELGTLPLTRCLAASRLYVSRPVGPQDQPDFINAVAHLRTRLSALALLDQLQALEQRHRRIRQRHWGPRTLDLDLLLYGDDTLSLPRLRVPHPEMTARDFVLLPLVELAPQLRLPDGRRIAELAGTHSAAGEVKVLPCRSN